MVYLKELPLPLAETSDYFLDLFFEFATTYTEQSVLEGQIKQRQDKEKTPSVQDMQMLGYSQEEIATMQLR